jgi:hypothetical protein
MTVFSTLTFNEDLSWFSVSPDRWIRTDLITQITISPHQYFDHVNMSITLGMGEYSDSIYCNCRDRKQAEDMMGNLMDAISRLFLGRIHP